MAERATINQRIQIGPETTPGTAVAASKVVQCFNFKFGPKVETKSFRATGRRFVSTVEPNKLWTEIGIDGNMDYMGLPYILNSVWGNITPTTHTDGTLSKDWLWTPAVTGSIVGKTYTIEQGDSVRAHKSAYNFISGWSYKGDRSDFSLTATMMGQDISDGITMTTSPTLIPLAPVVADQVNIYLDTSDEDLGTTLYTRAFSFEFNYDSGFGPFWAINRANKSFTGHVDLEPKSTAKLLVEADATGMGLYTNLKAGDTLFIRYDALGPIIEDAIPYALQHDMALKLANISDFSDNDGIFAIEFEGEVVEDAAWGKAQELLLTNQLAAL